jgi:hypothetical protein
MRTVYLLLKHPRYPYNAQDHLRAGEVMGVYENRVEPDRIAAEKNARRPSYLWVVYRKRVKTEGKPGCEPSKSQAQ